MPLTLGIEEEYQIIDPETRQLASGNQQLLDEGAKILGEQIKPEFMQSQVEVGTRVCRDISEARSEIVRLRKTVSDLANDHGLGLAAASTHPISSWSDQTITGAERYRQLEDDLRHVVRRLLIFGMHVHIGIEDPELRIDVMN
ncbi:MAG: glutamate-cysteine ligase family protein, partial [Acidobacteriota bacterium]